MAGGDKWQSIEVDPAVERRWALSRREDLGESFGLMLSVPWHGQDELGVWRFGLQPEHGWSNQGMEDQFVQDMRALIEARAEQLVVHDVLGLSEVAAFEDHPYSVGPAAQEWPKIFFDLYHDARPFLSDGASLLAWAYFFKDVIKGVWAWAARKEKEQHETPGMESNTIYGGNSVMPSFAVTRSTVIALCYADLIDRHGVTGDAVLEVLPRSYAGRYASPDHPGGPERYLVRAETGTRSYYYLVLGTGEVLEHYAMERSALTLLDIPDLFGTRSGPQMYEPEPASGVNVSGASLGRSR